MNVAAVDIGTNSVRLLVADGDGAAIERLMRVTRLGQDVDATGRLQPEAIERTLAVLSEYAARLAVHDASEVRATATSAARDAVNATDFLEPAELVLGVRPEVISGRKEAHLSFAGATDALDASAGPFLVIDIGGGSTEFILGTNDPDAAMSVNMGCVRITERFLHSDPPAQAELDNASAAVDVLLGDVGKRLDVTAARRLVGVAGTVTTLAALDAGLDAYDPSVTHLRCIPKASIDRHVGDLACIDTATRRGRLIEPKRADVIVGGALVLARVMHQFGFDEVLVSEHDILDGLVMSLIRGSGDSERDG